MNSQEKKALFQFVTLYTISSIVLVAIIAYLYYEKELASQKTRCERNLKSTIFQAQSNLLYAKLENKNFHFQPENYELNLGLLTEKGQHIYSSLTHKVIDLKKKMVKNPNYVQLIHKLDRPLFNIRYIVAEDTSMPINKQKLITLIMIVIFFAFIFIAFIGYLLSHLLLKPVKEKIAHIDRFIKDSAHEINTPIASLLMSVSALKKKASFDPKILNHISISSKQIADVYNSLSHLAFDDIYHEKISTKVDFKNIVLHSVEFYREIAKAKQITIHTHCEALSIMIEKEDAKKLINNLLSNAIKYSKIKTEITITLQNGILSVKDQGMGIDNKEKKAILKRYHRASQMHGGFGIGLDIVNAIANYYGILLDIQSQKGQGSQFSLDFQAIVIKT